MANANQRKESATIKLKLLVSGVQDNPDLFEKISYEFKEEHYAYDNGNWGVCKSRLVPTELLLPSGIVSKIHFRPNSPLKIKKDGDIFILEEKGKTLTTFEFLKRPNFWNYCTSHGTPTKSLAQMYGKNCLNFNIYSGCQFVSAGYGCQFCSVKSTVDKLSSIKVNKQPGELSEVCDLATRFDNIKNIIITGGSYIDTDREFDKHMEVIRAIRHKLPWNGRIKGNVSLMPPKTESKLIELYQEGVDHPSFNLEVWPQTAFDKICPGKSRYVGMDKIIRSFEILVKHYGPGKVWCNFVAGIVPLSDIKSGFDAIAELGVVPGANIFHPEVGTKFGNINSSPDKYFILDLYDHASKIYQKYSYKPFFDSGILRNSLANEMYEGLL